MKTQFLIGVICTLLLGCIEKTNLNEDYNNTINRLKQLGEVRVLMCDYEKTTDEYTIYTYVFVVFPENGKAEILRIPLKTKHSFGTRGFPNSPKGCNPNGTGWL